MSTTALPLPLALRQPVPLAGDPDTLLGVGSTTYDPKTQVGVNAASGFHVTTSKSILNGKSVVDDLLNDVH